MDITKKNKERQRRCRALCCLFCRNHSVETGPAYVVSAAQNSSVCQFRRQLTSTTMRTAHVFKGVHCIPRGVQLSPTFLVISREHRLDGHSASHTGLQRRNRGECAHALRPLASCSFVCSSAGETQLWRCNWHFRAVIWLPQIGTVTLGTLTLVVLERERLLYFAVIDRTAVCKFRYTPLFFARCKKFLWAKYAATTTISLFPLPTCVGT